MIKKILMSMAVITLLSASVAYAGAALPAPKSMEVIFESAKVGIAIATLPDGSKITVVIMRGRDAEEISKQFEGATSLYNEKSRVLILLDLSISI